MSKASGSSLKRVEKASRATEGRACAACSRGARRQRPQCHPDRHSYVDARAARLDDRRREQHRYPGGTLKPEKTGAAKHSADYRDRKKAEADRLGIEKMYFDMPAGIRKQLAAEIKVHGYSQLQELWQDLALSWIAQAPDERARRLQKPDAPAFHISQRLARPFEDSSLAELRRNPGDEIASPISRTPSG